MFAEKKKYVSNIFRFSTKRAYCQVQYPRWHLVLVLVRAREYIRLIRIETRKLHEERARLRKDLRINQECREAVMQGVEAKALEIEGLKKKNGKGQASLQATKEELRLLQGQLAQSRDQLEEAMRRPVTRTVATLSEVGQKPQLVAASTQTG
ncbi:hypothetical protein EAI_02130 [Harpegnathos saltator]|uniref:Uncharacterized protein n=1 Tax=Harpegnathos saltator TaxID=610380 RepID=E2BAD0_HARSA|nr:hypothetical protein EAI_02130 [Harpegnathos saltator]